MFNKISKEEKNRILEMYGCKKTIQEDIDISGRMSMGEFLRRETDNVDTLIEMMSKYTPKDYWLVRVGYINNTNINVKVKPSDEIEAMGRGLGDDFITSLLDSPDYQSGKLKHPFAEKTVNKEKIPSSIYKLKTYTCQWLSPETRKQMKAQKDFDVMSMYQKHGIEPPEVDLDDKRGLGWEPIDDTPFDQHINTGNRRFVMYRKRGCYTDAPSLYFIKYPEGNIERLDRDKVNFYFKLSQTNNNGITMPQKLAQLEDQELAKKILSIENLYEFKNILLDKITFLNCTAETERGNVKLSYVNKNVVPDGVEPGSFRQFIEDEIDK